MAHTAPTLPTIDVLLPAYNGGVYIAAQIQSIIDQDYEGQLRIHVRDDGSSDGTVAVVQQMQKQPLPAQRALYLMERRNGEGGVSENIAALLHAIAADANYIAFADQDDLWLPHKLTLQMQAMQQAEAKNKATTPVLVYSDLTVVDAELQPLHNSFWAYQKLSPLWSQRWQDLLVQNTVTGCTVLVNQAATAVILPMPTEHGVVHDHWIATAVAYYGQVVPLTQPTVLYRQHSNNVIGAHAFTLRSGVLKLKQLLTITQRSQTIALALGQPQRTGYLMINKLRLGFKRLFLKVS